jgi:hypothetical protein
MERELNLKAYFVTFLEESKADLKIGRATPFGYA